MKKIYTRCYAFYCVGLICLLFSTNTLMGQGCVNADFSDGNFTGWTGTYFKGVCTGTGLFGNCTCSATVVTHTAGINSGPVNNPVTDANNEYNHTITSAAGGNDPNITSLGGALPVAYPSGSGFSARLGNMWQLETAGQVGGLFPDNSYGDGETLSYSFVVDNTNCNFTYHYAVVLYDGQHSAGQQPFFNIAMTTANGDSINCATYQVDATTAHTIGGFTSYPSSVAGYSIFVKPWSSVFIPLNNYIGQSVKITFTTRGCTPSGCAGSHYAYAYVAAECAPLTLVASSPTVCGGQNLTLTAPQGAASYAWTGPGIVSGANQQVVTIDQPGQYIVNMTTFGNTPCNFSLDTVMVGNPANPQAIFSAQPVCVGNPTTFSDLSTPAPNITAWSWDFGDGSPVSSAHNPTHTYAAAGTYAVTLTVTSTPCTKDTTINVTVSPPPTSTFTATSPVCEGTNSIITYTGNAPAGDTYTWNFQGGTGTPMTGQGPLAINWATGGTKTVTLTVSAGSCSSQPSTQTVVVNPFPGLSLTPHQDICAGSSATLVASGATNYTWAADPTLSSTTNSTVQATPTVTTIYTITGTSTNCTATDTVSVSVYPVPNSTFTVTSPICLNQHSTVTYTGNATSTATYNWNFGGGTSAPASGQGPFQVGWNAPGSQTVTLTVSQNGCSSTLTSNNVVVNPSPTSSFTASSPICLGQNSTVTFNGTADNAALYSWNFGTGTIVSGTAGTAGPYTINWTTAGNQNISLSVSDNGCTSTPTTQTVVVSPIPTATFSALSPVCVGQSSAVTYQGNADNLATYTWDFGTGVATPGSGAGPQSVVWSAEGTQNITLVVSENGCTGAPVTMPVTVNPTPTATFTASGPVCVGSPSTVTYTGTGDNLATYTWNYGSGTAAPPGTGQGPQSVTWNAAGIQNIILTVSANGCTSPPYTVPVTVNATPTTNFTVTSPLCVGQVGTVTYTGISDAQAVFNWNFSGGTVLSGSIGTAGPYTVKWGVASEGTQMLSLAITDNGCPGISDSVPVVINPTPVSNAGPNLSYCSGNTAVIGGPVTGGYSCSWSPAQGLSNVNISNPTVSLTTSSGAITTQTYTVTTTSNSCTSKATVVVTVNPVPVAQFVTPLAQCLTGNSFNFVSLGANLNSAVYSWTFNGATPVTSASQTQSVTYGAAATYPVSLVVMQGGCSDSASSSVVVNPMPQVVFQPDTTVGCENFNVCFNNISSGTDPLLYNWTFGDGGVSSDKNPCHLFVAPGFYSVGLKVTSAQQCVSEITQTNLIQVVADPTANFTPSATVVQQPESEITFKNESLNAANYLWNFSNAGVYNNVIGNSTNTNPAYNFTQYGLYSVQLFAYNNLGCADSITEQVKVLPPQNFFVPNAFTPNGDGNNDEFYIYTQEGATVTSFQVFNRWGEKVFDGLYPWDGFFKEKKSPEGVYVYHAKIHLIEMNIDIERKGSVTLIR